MLKTKSNSKKKRIIVLSCLFGGLTIVGATTCGIIFGCKNGGGNPPGPTPPVDEGFTLTKSSDIYLWETETITFTLTAKDSKTLPLDIYPYSPDYPNFPSSFTGDDYIRTCSFSSHHEPHRDYTLRLSKSAVTHDPRYLYDTKINFSIVDRLPNNSITTHLYFLTGGNNNASRSSSSNFNVTLESTSPVPLPYIEFTFYDDVHSIAIPSNQISIGAYDTSIANASIYSPVSGVGCLNISKRSSSSNGNTTIPISIGGNNWNFQLTASSE